jgi:hypothetical protein
LPLLYVGITEQGVEQVQRAKQRKRKAGNVVMDDLDNLLIKWVGAGFNPSCRCSAFQ